MLPIKLKPKRDVCITLVYENLLQKMENKYRHVISLSPGSKVSDFQVVMLQIIYYQQGTVHKVRQHFLAIL